MKKEEIDAVLNWANKYVETPVGPKPGCTRRGESDNSIIYGLLTLILAVIGLILLQVNSNLKKLTDEKAGIRTPKPVPFYRNKAYLLVA